MVYSSSRQACLVLSSLLLILFPLFSSAQLWKIVPTSDVVAEKGIIDIAPESYLLAEVNDSAIKDILWSAPNERDVSARQSSVILPVMNRNGEIEEFSIVRYKIKEAALAAKFPNIRSFIGMHVSKPGVSIRADYTVHGLRLVINHRGVRTYIDHYQRNDKVHKVIYNREELRNSDPFTCYGPEEIKSKNLKAQTSNSFRAGDCALREYQIAVTATGEYSNFHGATSAAQSNLVQSAIETSINRVNDVYEIDATSRFVIIGTNDLIYYYNPATDPFQAAVNGTLLNQNQSNTDNVIGNGNYDIGHIYTQGDGGIAQLRSLCTNSGKARGATGRNNPVGDPFDIDYVAHEIGHQFGGNHTQNNSCNRSANNAVEPGSASTIMGYAGICSPNVQNNSDPYFHGNSMEEMNDWVVSQTCDTEIAWGNNAPTINSFPTNKTLPISTPFVLDATASANNAGDDLVYCWEQMDVQAATMPPVSTNTGGPAFRSLLPTADSKRYFPSIDNVVNGTTDTWEVLPSVSRSMDFRLTVRDFHNGQGGCHDEDDITLTFDAGSGPFEVTSQNSMETYLELENVTVTWDVAGTDAAPVSCSEVEILLSYDGGLTYPTVLTTNAPNNGSAVVTLPVGTTTTGRFMVKCSDNYFFDINDANFTIDIGVPTFLLDFNPTQGVICNTATTYSFDVVTTSLQGFNTPIDLTASGLPPGSSGSFSSNPVTPGQTSTLTITNIPNQTGSFPIQIRASAGAESKGEIFDLSIVDLPAPPTQISPVDGAVGVSSNTTLTWSDDPTVSSYDYEVGTTAGANDVLSGSNTQPSVLLSNLGISTTYYWRVRAVQVCGPSAWSPDFSFTTRNCTELIPTDLPITISSSGTPTITSAVTSRDRGDIVDLNVLDLEGTHTWINDLEFTLIAPDNTSQVIWDRPCEREDDFDINLDDQAANGNWPCPPVDGQTYIPSNPLSVFNNATLKGTWTMSVRDVFNSDGGSLDKYTLEVCFSDFCDLTVDKGAYDGAGAIQDAVDCAIAGDTIFLEEAIPNNTISIGSNTVLIDKDIVIVGDVNTMISANHAGPAIEISDLATVKLIDIDIKNTNGIGLLNEGTLVLENVNILTDGTAEQVVNTNGASISLQGVCNLELD